MTRVFIAALAAGTVLAVGAAAFAGGKARQEIWNLTGETITVLQFAPAGTERFGPNQTLNDDNHAVENDERLPLKGLRAGRYDVRFTDALGRTCLVRGIAVTAKGRVDLRDPDESACTRR